ncbi:uncharacterized protein BT62DRAFT_1011683 [Guyanagaster necrorhizus]|uniref:Uncharacterized protein n=1 Tax=Guyanagaster necrorhizus TaxID=856835 RepID=A0A9P7VIY4_9AGAR|nr:uncharacterized protein BT62DRAFT_1011683 [Guyanagaster necrorhizus MCA 3950]KAG7441428.1 hypothetical protein BT62DRAFT_1011683 [Guyanagaster necrorhizus MCA 3950]
MVPSYTISVYNQVTHRFVGADHISLGTDTPVRNIRGALSDGFKPTEALFNTGVPTGGRDTIKKIVGARTIERDVFGSTVLRLLFKLIPDRVALVFHFHESLSRPQVTVSMGIKKIRTAKPNNFGAAMTSGHEFLTGGPYAPYHTSPRSERGNLRLFDLTFALTEKAVIEQDLAFAFALSTGCCRYSCV